MKLSALRDFSAVCECGSLRAAARLVGVTQPAITRSIQELEKELGAPLLERRSQGVRPTAVGEAFLRRARAVGNEIERARQEAAQLSGKLSGSLVVCMTGVPQITLLPDSLRLFHKHFPRVRLDVVDSPFHRVQLGLVDGSMDFYVGPLPRRLPGELVAERLFEHSRVVIGRRGHPKAQARSLRELTECEWIAGTSMHNGDDEISPLFLAHGLTAPRIAMQAHSALTYLLGIVNSDMLMMVPAYWAHFPIWRDSFEVIEVAEALHSRPICLVHKPAMPLTPAAEFFCDLLRRAAGRMPQQEMSDAGRDKQQLSQKALCHLLSNPPETYA
jgi:LysR family transcriptional regulator, regulator of abg operon